jgi:hypothetical protein
MSWDEGRDRECFTYDVTVLLLLLLLDGNDRVEVQMSSM